MSRRLLLIVLALATLGLSACGEREETITRGESEAEYVTLGDMQYQVQLSRRLNQFNEGDRSLLTGVPPTERILRRGDVWFAVWMRIWNRSEGTQVGADSFKIVDTRGQEYEPVPLAATNAFAYRARPVASDTEYPVSDSAAGQSPTAGSLVLFKLPERTLDFRPLELEFSSSALPGRESSIRLDV
ncbi:MAG: hypothetical protein MUC84_00030 [Solirubrobacteraceae bacterium]|nr:hypothetical protein [Solirubrobacteraceae bacterium]